MVRTKQPCHVRHLYFGRESGPMGQGVVDAINPGDQGVTTRSYAEYAAEERQAVA